MNYSWTRRFKNCENISTGGEVMVKIKVACFFLEHGVYWVLLLCECCDCVWLQIFYFVVWVTTENQQVTVLLYCLFSETYRVNTATGMLMLIVVAVVWELNFVVNVFIFLTLSPPQATIVDNVPSAPVSTEVGRHKLQASEIYHILYSNWLWETTHCGVLSKN